VMCHGQIRHADSSQAALARCLGAPHRLVPLAARTTCACEMCPDGSCAKDGACVSSTGFVANTAHRDDDNMEVQSSRLKSIAFLCAAGFSAAWISMFLLWRSRSSFCIRQQSRDMYHSLDANLLSNDGSSVVDPAVLAADALIR